MGRKRSVFDSDSEREYFFKIKSIWNKRGFEVYPQLPFSKILEIDTLDVNSKERKFLLMTNIDITLCRDNQAILSIEFDGVSYGFSRYGKYVQVKDYSQDMNRKLKLDLKISLCEKDKYPFYVVSYDEFYHPDSTTQLTIIDGIIGQTLANLDFRNKIDGAIEDNRAYIENLSHDEHYWVVQDIITDQEIESEYEWDPIVQKNAEMFNLLHENGYKPIGWSQGHMEYPEAYSPPSFFDIKGLHKRLEDIKNAEKIGCKYAVKIDNTEYTAEFWMRNIDGSFASPLLITEHIAEMLAYTKACKTLKLL